MRNWKETTDWASVEFDFDRIAAARGNDRIYGTAGDDDLRGTRRDDRFDLSQGGDDVAHGGAGNDRFRFEETFDENDRVFGGAGNDKVILLGDYRDGVFIDPEKFVGVEKLILESGATVRIGDGFDLLKVLSSGYSINVDASNLISGKLIVRGSGNKDVIIGGEGNDTIRGGGLGDTLVGNGGADKFTYSTVSDSRVEFSLNADIIMDFTKKDVIVLPSGYDVTYKIANSGDRVGNIVLAFDMEADRTSIEIYFDSDPAADMTIFLSGSHLDLMLVNSNELVLG